MTSYRQIEDFLSDEEFRAWVFSGQKLEGSAWESKADDDPVLLARLRSAIDLLRKTGPASSVLPQGGSDADLQKALDAAEEQEVARILSESRRFNLYGWGAAVTLLIVLFCWLLIHQYL